MTESLDDIIGALNKETNLTSFSETDDGEIKDWIPTLIPVFDANLEGGIPASGQVSEIFGPPSSGKAVKNGTPVPTPNGNVPIENIKVGDYVFDRHGKPTKVIGVYPQGKKDAYKITFKDNRTLVVNNEHLWSVFTSRGRLKTIKTQEMIDQGLIKSYKVGEKFGNTYRYVIPNNEWVMFNNKSNKLPVNPYVIGVLLGDGCLKERQLTISSDDEFVIKKVSTLLKQPNIPVKRKGDNYSWTFELVQPKLSPTGQKITKIQTKDLLISDLPLVDAHNKYIPTDYLTSTKENRLALLQGLMDTDGSSDKSTCTATFSTTSEQLAQDVASLGRSLGYSVYVSNYDRSKDNKATEYYLSFHSSSEELQKLFTLQRKKERIKKDAPQVRSYRGTSIVSIESLHKQEEMTCLMVDNPEHLYLVGDYIVTHNTTAAGVIIKNAQKMGVVIVYYDVEGTQHASRLEELGADPHGVLTYTPTRKKDGTIQELSIEQIGESIIDTLARVHEADPKRHVLFFWDSIAMSNSEMQATNELGQALVGQQAKALATVGRKVQANLNANNGTLIAFNQARDDFNAPVAKYAQAKTVGGKGWAHLLSTRIRFNQSGKLYKKSTDKKPIGTQTRVKVVKSKIGDNMGADFTMDIIGAWGYDFEYNLVESAQENGLITKGRSPKYVNENGEEVIKGMNVYDLVEKLKQPENEVIRYEIWQRLVKLYFENCYPALFNTELIMTDDKFPMIKGLRAYYIEKQQALDPKFQNYNYRHFMEAYHNKKLPKDIMQEVKEVLK